MTSPAISNSVAHSLREVSALLEAASPSPRLDAALLLCHIMEVDRSVLITHPEVELTCEQKVLLDALTTQRMNGVPIAYLTGIQEFWSLPFKVSQDVLVPRPETELLVELALKLPTRPTRIADLGTGSGAIAIALAKELPDSEIVAIEKSPPALQMAVINAEAHRINNISIRYGDWCDGLGSSEFDLCVSNPPYIADGDPHLEGDGVRHEPAGALTSGPDGLDAIRKIISSAPLCLRSNAWLMLEHGADQGSAVAELMHKQGLLEVQTHADYAGKDRVTVGRKA